MRKSWNVRHSCLMNLPHWVNPSIGTCRHHEDQLRLADWVVQYPSRPGVYMARPPNALAGLPSPEHYLIVALPPLFLLFFLLVLSSIFQPINLSRNKPRALSVVAQLFSSTRRQICCSAIERPIAFVCAQSPRYPGEKTEFERKNQNRNQLFDF